MHRVLIYWGLCVMNIIDGNKNNVCFKDVKVNEVFYFDFQYYLKIQTFSYNILPRDYIEGEKLVTVKYNAVCVSECANVGRLMFFNDEVFVHPVESTLIVNQPIVYSNGD